MSGETKFQDRIAYKGNLNQPLNIICRDYNLGAYQGHEVVLVGYEDFNVILQTSKGKFFVKFFGEFRTNESCERYVTIIRKTIEAGVREPKLFESGQGYISHFMVENARLRSIVMEYIEGKTFYELGRPITEDEARETVRQAALINSVSYQPKFIYDSWAIPSFLKEYRAVETLLPSSDQALIQPLVDEFEKTNIDSLPHALVHGDIIKTNVMLSREGQIYIIDFAVTNYYPRIQELAVVLCNMLFDTNHLELFAKYYEIALDEYQKTIQLTSQELLLLPFFTKVQHAMHIVGAVREEKIKNNTPSAEDDYLLNQGRKGLAFMLGFKG
jgi:Ser/Thr protein kinase RdoA (MazF antagonist)